MNWELYKNFKPEEFACQHCGKEGIKEELLNRLQALRTFLNFSFVVSSGYRCPEHPIEAKKSKPGTHSTGLAVDILCRGTEAYKIITHAKEYGFTGKFSYSFIIITRLISEIFANLIVIGLIFGNEGFK